MAATRAVTILFCDLVASTERRAHLGDDAFDEFTARFLAALRSAITTWNGREMSSAGDGLMVAFEASVADAVSCALAMHAAMPGLDEDDPPRIRVGISTGEVAHNGNEYSGMPIVEAARLEAAAAPGQTLANAVVRALVGSRRAFAFRDIGSLSLKGIPEPLSTVEVVGERTGPPPDPPGGAAASRPRPPVRARERRSSVLVAGLAVVFAAVAIGLVVSRSGDRGSARTTGAPAPGVTAPAGYVPQYSSAPCPAGITQVAADASCGHLVVPEDRRKPNGRQVSLLVTRAPPRTPGADPRAAPSIDVCGCEDVGNSVTRDHAELIHVAQRGSDGSDPQLTCPEMTAARMPSLALAPDDAGQLGQSSDALAACYRRLTGSGIDVAQYNFVAAGQDVLDLMVALHIPQADFTAHGSNDEIVFTVLRQAPGAVRSITLDNPTAPGESTMTDAISNLAGAFDRFAAICAADVVCTQGYGDLKSLWHDGQSGARAVAPTLVATPNPDDDAARPVPVLLDTHREADALANALDNPDTYSLIPAVLADASASVLASSQVLQNDPFDWQSDFPWGAVASYVCSYAVHTTDTNVVAQEARSLPDFIGDVDSHWVQWCRSWPVPDRSSDLSVDVATAVPTFLFRGDLSPYGNSNQLAKIQRGLSNGQVAIFPTLGDDLLASGPPCLSDLRRQFLTDPAAKLDPSTCVAQSPKITFTPPPSS